MITVATVEAVDMHALIVKAAKCGKFYLDNTPGIEKYNGFVTKFFRNEIYYVLHVEEGLFSTVEDYRVRVYMSNADNEKHDNFEYNYDWLCLLDAEIVDSNINAFQINKYIKGAWVLELQKEIEAFILLQQKTKKMINEVNYLVGNEFWE